MDFRENLGKEAEYEEIVSIFKAVFRFCTYDSDGADGAGIL